eukprot:797432-Amphidinium_carterae.1
MATWIIPEPIIASGAQCKFSSNTIKKWTLAGGRKSCILDSATLEIFCQLSGRWMLMHDRDVELGLASVRAMLSLRIAAVAGARTFF